MYQIKANKHHYYAGYYSEGYPVFNLYSGKKYSFKDVQEIYFALKSNPEFTMTIKIV